MRQVVAASALFMAFLTVAGMLLVRPAPDPESSLSIRHDGSAKEHDGVAVEVKHHENFYAVSYREEDSSGVEAGISMEPLNAGDRVKIARWRVRSAHDNQVFKIVRKAAD